MRVPHQILAFLRGGFRSRLLRFFLSLLVLCTLGAAVAAPPGKRLLLFVGSNTLGERAVPELAKSWLETEKQAKNVTIVAQGETIFVSGRLADNSPVYVEIHATGSGDCFKSFAGLYPQVATPCDIGMSSRSINEGELKTLQEKTGSEFNQRGREPGQGCEHPVAMDGLAIIVHRSNPLSRISFGELKAIYSRQVTDWKQLAEWKDSGGAAEGGAIAPLRRKEPSGTLDFFKERIRPDPAAMSDTKAIPAFTSSSDLAEKVAATPGGIGFVGQSYALHPGVKRLQVYDNSPQSAMTADQAVFPDASAVSKQLYPLSRVVYLYTPTVALNPAVPSFIKFALSEQGQTVVADRGGLVKIEGTEHQITAKTAVAETADPARATAGGDGRKRHVILRLSGSNTVGAECAVNLAFNYFVTERQKSNPGAKIEDVTTPIETPEGEKALIHAVMCDLDKDGMPQTIEIRPTGSSDAFTALRNGSCDVGMSSRPITDAERRDLMPICGDLSQPAAQYGLGLDALAIVVSNANKVEQLTLDQVRGIFLGEITKWSQVGGDDRPIQLHARPERSGTFKYFCDAVLLGRTVPAAAKRHAENSLLSAAVAEDPDGIGFLPMSTVGHAKVLKIGHEGSANSYKPTEESVRAGRYPVALCRYVYFYVPASPPNSPSVEARHNWETARDFAEMSQHWRGQAVIANSGFVTDTSIIDETGQARRTEGEAILPFLLRLTDLERKVQTQKTPLRPKLVDDEICPRLLFEFDDWALTAESKNILDKKLGPWLRMYPAVAKSGLVAEGWADSVGSDEACRQISLQRARNVAHYIQESLGVEVASTGMGKSFDPPNTDEASKQQNRRVVIKAAAAALTARPADSTPKPLAKKKS
ncbi:MAG: phosphate ABC transporter substrate-binding/OmpA family protein [Chthoniobacter sp.]|nr:phosphate ABC transporter substrate-binding/OmpA family protein [Chthoniobacter sp.]